MAEALSSLSPVHDDELPVSLLTEALLRHSGFISSQRSVLDGDGDGDGCWLRRIAALAPSALYTSVGLGVPLEPVVDDDAIDDASSMLDDIECRMDMIDLRRRGL